MDGQQGSSVVSEDHRLEGDDTLIVIDGAHGEGGGQLVRNSIAYAAIMKQGLRIHNIRLNRSKPGLRPQHVTGIRMAADILGGSLEGAEPEAVTVTYKPPPVVEGTKDQPAYREIIGDTTTAGSICLLLQTSLPCALFAACPTTLILKGGTNADLAPQYDYWEKVFLPTLQEQLQEVDDDDDDAVEPTCVRRGYFPKGGGEVHVEVTPVLASKALPPIVMTDRGEVCELYIRSFVAGRLPVKMAKSMAEIAAQKLHEYLPDIKPQLEVVKEPKAVGSGSGILIVATTTTGCLLAGSSIGKPKKRPEQVAVDAANELVATLEDGGCVDEWLQDQLILFMALANGTSEIITGSLTLHTQTAIWLAEKVVGAKFEVTKLSSTTDDNNNKDQTYGKDGRISGRHRIRCQGVDVRRIAKKTNDT